MSLFTATTFHNHYLLISPTSSDTNHTIYFLFLSPVRYFQCEPYRGLFTRLHRLSRFPLDVNGNRLPIAEEGLVKTRRVCTPDGRTVTTVTRVTKSPTGALPMPHYALPTRPAKVITTVTTTTTTSLQKQQHQHPKSVLKSTSCRVSSSGNGGTPHHVHF